MASTLYDDGRYQITATVISTPQRLYPIANATARVRSDVLWVGLASAALTGAAIGIYGDLLTGNEMGTASGLSVLLVAIGTQVKVLSIDAFGHPRAMIFGSRRKINTLFTAIRQARMADLQVVQGVSTDRLEEIR